VTAICGEAQDLAADSVAETGLGVAEHKVQKITLAATETVRMLLGRSGSGLLKADQESKVTEIAAPMGVVLGLIPLTNPVPTIVFKVLCCLKSRNALILSTHRGAAGVGSKATDIIHAALEQHGASPDLVQCIKNRSSRKTTAMFMKHDGVSLILATGGPGMVKAAYSSGTPAIGVGCGNAPVWICPDADLTAAAEMIIASKSFDNGVICGSENNLVVDRAVLETFIDSLEQNGAAVLTKEETAKFSAYILDPETGQFAREHVGQLAAKLLEGAGIDRESEVKLVVVPVEHSMADTAWGREMLAPVISLFSVDGEKEGVDFSCRLLKRMGQGHTAIIHTRDEELAKGFGLAMPASRILHNCPGSTGCIGIGNGLRVSFTLGCGSWGNTSTTDNVGYLNLINIKRIAQAL